MIGYSFLQLLLSSISHRRLVDHGVVPEVQSCLFCHNTEVHNHYSQIIKTGRYGWSMDHAGAANHPSPLFSPFCFISSPLSISVRFMWPPCPSATECHPHPLPVSFIKPVRDEVKPWRQLFSLVSFFSCGWTPQAAGWSTIRCSLMTEVFYWSIDGSASNTKAPLGLLTTLERGGSQSKSGLYKIPHQQRRKIIQVMLLQTSSMF